MVTPLDDDALIQASLDHFDAHQGDYQRLADELPGAVSERLRRSGLLHFRVEARAKRRESYEAKLRKDPRREIEDAVGVRVLVFFRAEHPLGRAGVGEDADARRCLLCRQVRAPR